MLPSTIEQGFAEGVWVPFPEFNGDGYPVAELKLKPWTHGDVAEVQEQFGICRRCDGMGHIEEAVPAPQPAPPPAEPGPPAPPRKIPCPVCAGKSTGKSALDLDVRLDIGSRLILDGRNFVGCDPQTREVRPLVWSDKVRDGLCRMLGHFFLIVGRAQELGAAQDAAKKGSSTQPPADSLTATPPAGVEG